MKNIYVMEKAMDFIGSIARTIYAFLSAMVYTIVLVVCGAIVASYHLIKKIIKEIWEKK